MKLQNTLEALDTFFLILSFVLGSMIGSFLNVCICRLPENQSVIKPRSRCPKCGAGIAWYDNIPVLSWLILGAKCRNCSQVISWQYPLVEALTGALFACVYWRFGATLASPVYMLLVAGLVLVTFVDLSHWIIPNEVTFPGIFLGVACALAGMFYPESGLLLDNAIDALIGVVAGGGVLYLLDKIALLVFKKRGMGFGDVKLLAMFGAFFGWQGVLFILMAASLVGSVAGLAMLWFQSRRTPAEADAKTKSTEETARGDDEEPVPEGNYLPFGPYLVVAGLLFLFFGQDLIDVYVGLMSAPAPITVLPVQ